MTFVEIIVVVLLCLLFILVFTIAGIINRLNTLEKITKDTIALIGKTAINNMGLGMNPGMGMKYNPSNFKPSKHNPLVG